MGRVVKAEGIGKPEHRQRAIAAIERVIALGYFEPNQALPAFEHTLALGL